MTYNVFGGTLNLAQLNLQLQRYETEKKREAMTINQCCLLCTKTNLLIRKFTK